MAEFVDKRCRKLDVATAERLLAQMNELSDPMPGISQSDWVSEDDEVSYAKPLRSRSSLIRVDLKIY